ncbi:uncharacterized protein EV420DRAFT_712239 [Desarmillaria tabescens]|uniref:DUF2306 domain-containing protein n=1 Tax=Armillaria tabescens TaxID=1929756 RepID=A0AA39JYK7_ARMTA|nr:uncharacterized protein EV420DRAFT_712239 [Desarmillaria tabescens]KAK0451327.1 hypothetical protein EV420DRAFT_712239 [Desarmillaria tabescens]
MTFRVAFSSTTMSIYSPGTIASELPDPCFVGSNEDTDTSHRPFFNAPPSHSVAKPHQKVPGSSVYLTISSIVGFKQRFSLLLFIIFGGALAGFCLYSARTMNFTLMEKYAPPGQWFWYNQKIFKAPYAIHIYTAVIGGIFSLFQFLPAIRRRAVLVHRLNGYFVLILLIPSNVAGAIIGYRAFGGEINSQSMYYTLGILSASCLIIGLCNVKRNTREHRKWMIRGVVIFSTDILTHLITLAARQIITDIGDYYSVCMNTFKTS